MVKAKQPKQYLKCSLKFDWHLDSGAEPSSAVAKRLSEFLISKGFKRNRPLRVRKEKGKEPEEEPFTSQKKSDPPQHEFACVGLRSVLRGMESRELKAVVIDASILKPTALSTSLAFYANGCKSFCDVYAISGLDGGVAKDLNVKTVTAVGFKAPSEDIIEFLKANLSPVGLFQEGGEKRMATMEMSTPIGKVGKKKKKRSSKSNV